MIAVFPEARVQRIPMGVMGTWEIAHEEQNRQRRMRIVQNRKARVRKMIANVKAGAAPRA